jgi:tetratricopeptide (TPR) repeat protein
VFIAAYSHMWKGNPEMSMPPEEDGGTPAPRLVWHAEKPVSSDPCLTRRAVLSLLSSTGLVIGLGAWPTAALANPKERIDYWQKNYDELTPRDDPRAERAHAIFQRILSAAGTRPGVIPRLYITQTDPWNISLPIAIPDGGVILSKGALDICYRDSRYGDDRLAFVLAHEIAHQLKDDFWHMKFFQALEASKTHDPQQQGVYDEVRNIAALTAQVRAKELQADEHAIVYAAMAGFHSHAIVTDDDRVNFFVEWSQALDPSRIPGVQTDPSHSPPQVRAATVKARLRQILSQIEVFQVGLWLYQAGAYEHAIHAFEEFLRYFPGREVYHNLATSHHQLALQHFRRWKKDESALPWKLSLAFDPVTRASFITLRGSRSPAELFAEHLDQAIKFYERAESLDATYTPSLNNLGCALILKDDVYTAISKFQKVLNLTPDAPEALNNLGVAFLAAENSAKARAMLTKAHDLAKDYDAPLFNLGKLAYEQEHEADAQRYWRAYLQLDPVSPWAEAIYQALALTPPKPQGSTTSTSDVERLSGVQVGAFREDLPPAWGEPERRRDMMLGGERFTLAAYKNQAAILWLDDEVHLIATLEGYQGQSARGIGMGSGETDVRAAYGSPSRRLHLTQGATWVYDAWRIAFQLRGGKVVAWQLF